LKHLGTQTYKLNVKLDAMELNGSKEEGVFIRIQSGEQRSKGVKMYTAVQLETGASVCLSKFSYVHGSLHAFPIAVYSKKMLVTSPFLNNDY
jgi:hypothetical protein